MTIREIKAKSILRKYKKIDSWFISAYGMNLYRGCTHNCIYCDGRSEGYYVDGEFGEDVTVKVNAIEILRRELIEAAVRKASEVGIDFIIFGGMTLKEGKQKDYFFDVLKNNYPETITEYQLIYAGDKWGQASGEYYNSINLTFNRIAKKYKMPTRIPPALYSDIVSENDLVIVILEHIDYLLKQEGKKSPYGFAAYSISQLKEPLSTMKAELRKIKGVGRTTEVIIREILETGSSGYYEKMLDGRK
ncbi:MAG: hypothetical protein WBE22_01350 [Halobacteriota archaeon]